MTDDITARIAAILCEHSQADEYGYDIEECRCGATFPGTYAEHVAEVLVRELGLEHE